VALGAAILAVLVTMVLALIRAFEGPSAYDRMLAANLFGTKTVLVIALGGYMLDWHSFLDVALLYALVNFVSTIAVMRFFEYSELEPDPSGSDASEDGGAT
jgi:multicomponent Na+:H+ antiporter subunit F